MHPGLNWQEVLHFVGLWAVVCGASGAEGISQAASASGCEALWCRRAVGMLAAGVRQGIPQVEGRPKCCPPTSPQWPHRQTSPFPGPTTSLLGSTMLINLVTLPIVPRRSPDEPLGSGEVPTSSFPQEPQTSCDQCRVPALSRAPRTQGCHHAL